MTNVKKILSIAGIILILGFLIAGIYIHSSIKYISNNQDYNARKEDLMTQQKKLELLISNLNETLTNQLILEGQLSNSSIQANVPVVETPAPTRVTRAS
jgi:hypothetical protein